MQMNDELFLLGGESTPLEVRPQVVDPAQAAALAAPLQPGIPCDVAPATLSVVQHVVHELVVLLRGPESLSQPAVVAVAVFDGRIG